MERYAFIKPAAELQQDSTMRAAVVFGLGLAQAQRTQLSVCVQSVNHGDGLLDKCFVDSKKLLRREKIIDSGVTVRLETVKTLNQDLSRNAGVILAVHPSSSLMDAIEAIEQKHAIVVFSQTENAEHLNEWLVANRVEKLVFKPR